MFDVPAKVRAASTAPLGSRKGSSNSDRVTIQPDLSRREDRVKLDEARVQDPT
jgi:hypothetical protein